MIILAALEIKDDPNYKVMPNNPFWRCMEFEFGGKKYAIAFEESFYGNLIRQFAIDGNVESDVKDKYMENMMVRFSEVNSLCGKRAFEQNSITYEYLLKPLGLQRLSFAGGYKSVCYITYMKQFCEKNNLTYKEWTY